ncbi:MAG: type II secretion system minor pseudopilin GspH [Proteobacteria bacterium]|nr:type II secretion system minor pseudopilin GspH [Pseudomonadota bacterium]MBU1709088.1 type II secretion system minor pseudopilin GspH [Pseudomonadota bacterium]
MNFRDSSQKDLPFDRNGFTLLEIMVVLLIIGIVIGVAAFSIDTRKDEIEIEARRFVSLIDLAMEEAVLKGEEYAVRFTHEGYVFLRHEEGRWLDLEKEGVFRSRRLPEGVRFEISLEGESAAIKDDREEGSSDDEKIQPEILLLSSGEYTQFEVRFIDRYDSNISFNVIGDPLKGFHVMDESRKDRLR